MNENAIVFSIGLFKDTKKLFSYEQEGKFYLPIYTDSEAAAAFQAALHQAYGKDVEIQANLCVETRHLIEMLKTVASIHQELLHVIINPNLVSGDKTEAISLVTEEHLISDYIEHLEAKAIMNIQDHPQSP